jgi:hypothetical protein
LAIIRLEPFEDAVVIHFGTEATRINAYTLATTLISVADAAKAANAAINPGYEIEVVVEALGPGSFKATVRTIYHEAGNLFFIRSAEEYSPGSHRKFHLPTHFGSGQFGECANRSEGSTNRTRRHETGGSQRYL